MSFPNKAEQVGALSPYSINPDDIGKNWFSLGDIAFSFTLSYLGSGIVIEGDDGGEIRRSIDYGVTWIVVQSTGLLMIASTYLGNGIALFGAQDGHIFRSTDFGVTWTDLGDVTSVLDEIDTLSYLGNGIVIFATTGGHIWRSTDYGSTWSDLGIKSASGFAYYTGSTYTDNGIVIAPDNGGNIIRSVDYGANWSTIAVSGSGFRKAVYLTNGICLVPDGNGHLWRSIDYGLTWIDQSSTGGGVALAYLGNGVVISGVGDHIWRSTNYGITWTDLGLVGVSPLIEAMAYLGNGIVIAASGVAAGEFLRSDISYKLDECMPSISVGMSDIGNTTGTTGLAYQRLVIAGGNNITISQSITSGSATITISAGSVGAGSFSAGVCAALGNSCGDTGVIANRLILAGGNNITLSESTNGGSATITISGGAASFSAGVSTLGNTAGATGIISQRLILAGGNNITLSESINGGSATITISAGAASFSAGVSTLGNTAGNTGTVSAQLIFVGGNNITLSESSNGGSATITISAGAASFSGGVSNVGNTSGATGTVSAQIVFAGGNNITLSQSVNAGSATITVSGASVGAGSFSAGVSTLGNTSGMTGIVANQLVLAGGNNVTLSQSINGQSATVTISAQSIAGQTIKLFQPVQAGDITSAGLDLTSKSINFLRVSIPAYINATEYDVIGSMNLATNSTGGFSLLYGIYTMTGNTANLITNSTTKQGTTFTSGSATGVSNGYGGLSARRFRSVSLGTWNFTPGEYLFGIGYSAANNVSMTLAGPHRVDVAGIPGGGNYTNYFFDGIYSTSTNAFPLTMNLNDIIRTGDNLHIWWLALIGTGA